MANICNYEIRVKGSKLAALFVYAAMPCYNEKEIRSQRGMEDAYELHFTGDCKWSVDSYCSSTWDKDLPDLSGMGLLDEDGYVNEEAGVDYWYYTLREKSRVLSCEIGAYSWSEESAFMEFVLYKNGNALKKETRKYAKSVRFDWETLVFVSKRPKKAAPVEMPSVPEEELWETETLKNGTLRICAYRGSAEEVVVPEQIGERRVTIIGKKAFSAKHTKDRAIKKYLRTSLKRVILPAGIETIEQSAFEDCRSLGGISVPKGVKKIGGYAFRDCAALPEIILPEGVKKIGTGVFEGCTGLTNVVISNGVKEIETYVFHNCAALTEITIPAGVTALKQYAFFACTGLRDIRLPGELTEIDADAFCSCKEFTIHAPAGSYAETYAKEHNIPFVTE